VIIGVMHAFGILIFPKITLVLVFLIMAVVLVVRPHGLMGRKPSGPQHGPAVKEPLLSPATREVKMLGAAALGVLVAAPVLLGNYGISLLTELVILTLFAASLHFIMGPGGLASFGHAAYFGLGAYGAALAAKWLAAPMLAGMIVAPIFAGIAGVIFGWFCVRLSGVYLAMLTLAFAQIAWSVAFQWVELTGGDNGILGVWPSQWASGKVVYYYLALVFCTAAVLALRAVIFAPFGYALRAGRDSPVRAEAIGLNVTRINWAAFVVAAVAAGIAGGLYAYFKGSVFPTYMAIPKSVDALLMVLLGGVQTVTGPIVGAFAFVWLQDWLVRAISEYWRFVLGASIVVIVLAFPQGLAGSLVAWRERRGSTPAAEPLPEAAR
jgi:branched-chain amino acid transport system permease protein